VSKIKKDQEPINPVQKEVIILH